MTAATELAFSRLASVPLSRMVLEPVPEIRIAPLRRRRSSPGKSWTEPTAAATNSVLTVPSLFRASGFALPSVDRYESRPWAGPGFDPRLSVFGNPL